MYFLGGARKVSGAGYSRSPKVHSYTVRDQLCTTFGYTYPYCDERSVKAFATAFECVLDTLAERDVTSLSVKDMLSLMCGRIMTTGMFE